MLRKSQLPDKLTPRNRGPYRVVKHESTWVITTNLINNEQRTFNQLDLTLFAGNELDAFKMAQLDNEQYVIDSIIAHNGNPDKRNTMDFLVAFTDGTKQWRPFSQDLFATVQYEYYCSSSPELRQLLVSAEQAAADKSTCNKLDITLVKPGDTVYVDIRSWGAGWYENITLPDKLTSTYVAECIYGNFCGSKNRPQKKLFAKFPAFNNSTYPVDNWFVNHLWSSTFIKTKLHYCHCCNGKAVQTQSLITITK